METHALAEVHLEIRRGEFVEVMGPSGCGKSTLLAVIGLLDTPSEGEYWLDGDAMSRVNPQERARLRNRHVGFIFQAFNLIGDLTVLENVELPLSYRGMPVAERRRRSLQALERVGMSHRVDHYPGQLSG
ncbi:MAG: ABC transporter ATP-binding protein, partial [Gemmatimonadota bacterium]